VTEATLQAKVNNYNKSRGKGGRRFRGRTKGGRGPNRCGDASDQNEGTVEQNEGSSSRGGRSFREKGRKEVNRKKIQCYVCQKFGHYSYECWHNHSQNKRGKKDVEAHLAHEGENTNSDQVLLMVTTTNDGGGDKAWYLDTGCSNHMTGNKDWLVDLDSIIKSSVRFADNSTITVEGVGKVLITRKDGKTAFMHNVLYVPMMKNNLLSLGQLLEKGYTMNMQQKCIKVYDEKGRLMFKTSLSKNRTFKIDSNTKTIQCMSSIHTEEEDWLWHYRFGHLNFNSLNQLGRKSMVSGLPMIQPPKKICEGCVISKHHRKKFVREALHKARQPLGVVFSDVYDPFSVESLRGNKYFLIFVDEYTRMIWLYLLKEKKGIFSKFVQYCNAVERYSEKQINILRTAGGGEFNSKQFAEFCA